MYLQCLANNNYCTLISYCMTLLMIAMLLQVINGLLALGRKAQANGYDGPVIGPKEAHYRQVLSQKNGPHFFGPPRSK